jgi:uncharacterized phage infection (PIP) family protein YhgE
MTRVEFETELDRTLRGDQGAAQRLIDHNKRLLNELSSIHEALTVPLISSRPLACYVLDLKQQLSDANSVMKEMNQKMNTVSRQLGEAQDTIKQLRETILYLEQESETQP